MKAHDFEAASAGVTALEGTVTAVARTCPVDYRHDEVTSVKKRRAEDPLSRGTGK